MADTVDAGEDSGSADAEHWDLEEVAAELAHLATPGAAPERRKIELRARIWAKRAGLDWRDLLHEAVARLLEGRRRWHRKETFTACLERTMKSIVRDHWRGQLNSIVAINDVPDGPSNAPDPERNALARDELADVLKALDDQKHTLEIAIGLARGDTAAEIKSRFGLTNTEYASALKRVRREVLKRRSSGEQP
jgi:DNA-directed RNA polymerase specialized sigma24 family protein